jgi:2-polyprenyl-6-methoxyphenol hydroxylase-like FAD-dependent oxidoreductase
VTDTGSSQDVFTAKSDHGTEERRERIRLETPRHRIEGTILIAADGYRSRVSDVLNASERDFLTLTDVTLVPLDGGAVEQHEFLAVARAHVVYVVAAPNA